MKVDAKLLSLLSQVFLDLSKAFFIAVFVTASISPFHSSFETWFVLTKNLLSGTVSLLIAWQISKLEKNYE